MTTWQSGIRVILQRLKVLHRDRGEDIRIIIWQDASARTSPLFGSMITIAAFRLSLESFLSQFCTRRSCSHHRMTRNRR